MVINDPLVGRAKLRWRNKVRRKLRPDQFNKINMLSGAYLVALRKEGLAMQQRVTAERLADEQFTRKKKAVYDKAHEEITALKAKRNKALAKIRATYDQQVDKIKGVSANAANKLKRLGLTNADILELRALRRL
jgi:hypothetical protein